MEKKREVPINGSVIDALIAHLKTPESSYIFCNRDGKPLTRFDKSFLAVLKKSDIINFRFHDLRHTFASHLIMSGIGINTVRELLGHKSLKMTLRYSHLSPSHKSKAVSILERKWAQNSPSETVKEFKERHQFYKILPDKELQHVPR